MLLHTAEQVALISWCSVYVTTQAVQMPALSHMELCLLLAAVALCINTATIKPIKINKVHRMKFLLPALAKKYFRVCQVLGYRDESLVGLSCWFY